MYDPVVFGVFRVVRPSPQSILEHFRHPPDWFTTITALPAVQRIDCSGQEWKRKASEGCWVVHVALGETSQMRKGRGTGGSEWGWCVGLVSEKSQQDWLTAWMWGIRKREKARGLPLWAWWLGEWWWCSFKLASLGVQQVRKWVERGRGFSLNMLGLGCLLGSQGKALKYTILELERGQGWSC